MKKAFIIGANREDIQYAVADALKLSLNLQKHTYSIFQGNTSEEIKQNIVKPYSRKKIKEEFEEFCKSCEKDDTVIFYFSGHGFVQKQELFFALNSSDPKELSTCLAATDILPTLKNSCKAEHQLLILDSCRSGAISNDFKFNTTDNFKILTAASTSLTAFEDKNLKAGVMTYYINETLEGKDIKATDRDGKLIPATLQNWLNVKIEAYNSNPENKAVPYVRLLGTTNNIFEIAVFEENLDPKMKDIFIKNNDLLRKQSKKIKVLSKRSYSSDVLKRMYIRNIKDFEQQINKIEDYIKADIRDRNMTIDSAGKLKFEYRIKQREPEILELAKKIDDLETKLNQL